MNNKKKIIIISCIAAVIIIAACVWGITGRNSENAETEQNTGTVQQTENIKSEKTAIKEEKGDDKAESEKKKTQETDEKSGKEEEKQDVKKEPEKVYTPTFMYFVSANDEGYDNTNKVIEELKKEYEGKINFDVRNIDEDKEAAENFSAAGNTPLLIMLNTKNDISAFNPKCSDKDMLKQAIEAALAAE